MIVRGASLSSFNNVPSMVRTALKASDFYPILKAAAKKEPAALTAETEGRFEVETITWASIHALAILKCIAEDCLESRVAPCDCQPRSDRAATDKTNGLCR